MTNESTIREKGRAVFLAALMVLSVVAMSAAFVGSAAAATDDVTFADQATTGSSVDVEITDVDQADRLIIENASEEIGNVSVDDLETGEINTIELDDEITADTLDTGADDYDAYLADATGAAVGADSTADSWDNATLSLVDDASAVDQGPVSYVVDESTDDYMLEIVYENGDFSNLNADQVEITNRNGDSVNFDTLSGDANGVVTLSPAEKLASGSTIEILGVEHDIETTSTTLESGTDDSAYVGETIAIVGTTNEEIDIETEDRTVTRALGENSLVRTLDTSGLSDGSSVNVTFSDDSEGTLELDDLGVTVETDRSQYAQGNPIEATVEADDINRDVEVRILDSEGEEVDGAVDSGSLDSDGIYNAQLTAPKPGDYTVEVEDVDSGITVESDSFSVTEEEQVANFDANQYEQEIGDVVEFTVELEDTDSAYVNLSEVDNNYDATLNLTDTDDDGEVTVTFNTYYAGQDSDKAFTSEDDEVEVASETSFDSGVRLLDADYELEAFVTEDRERATDASFLVLSERNTGDVTTAVAPADLAHDDDLETILEASSESDTVANSDLLVAEVEASGVYGYLLNDDGELADGTGLELNLTNTHEPRYNDAEQILLSDIEGDSATVHEDAANDTFYVVVDVAAVTDGDTTIDADETWNVEFAVTEDNDYVDEDERTDATFSVEERSVEITGDFDEDERLQVGNGEESEITADSNVAPGTEVRYNVRLPTEVIGFNTEVTDDGSIVGTFDLSNYDAGDEIRSISVTELGDDASDSTKGVIVDEDPDKKDDKENGTEENGTEENGTEDNGTEDNGTEDNGTEDNGTEDNGTEENGEEDDDEDGTPGFGIAVALVAMLAAAMLALRRQN
ncbi:surface glycoprotein [Haloterrigena alkaliphila]|uniref:Surface glycoprotein n=1 Tax=Haloterrigena alkaliphila TaxID=2816475 RepID=A0A8A2VIE0_9EURY|nr:surface glycoprotein [Haloterrigena alkaliphila]QSX01117.1 surface glycoprotein [Haloterrigena alkaliphila]